MKPYWQYSHAQRRHLLRIGDQTRGDVREKTVWRWRVWGTGGNRNMYEGEAPDLEGAKQQATDMLPFVLSREG